MKFRLFVSILGALALVTGSAAFAQRPSGTVELVNTVAKEVEVVEQGRKVKKLVPPTQVVPGDEVVYTLTYTNKGVQPAERVAIDNPVPTHTRYVDGSASGEGSAVTFSVDGGKSFAAPSALTVREKNNAGAEVVRPATAKDYTHIRWQLREPVAPGRSGYVRFKVAVQ